MSRIKSRTNQEICGDCGATDASWASINKGILLCTECSSIHRTLGRHISQIKSLQKSAWYPNQLTMVSTLNNNGANKIWEHTLLENGKNSLKKKPTPKDSIQIKAEFIKAKHLQCCFALRQNYDNTSSNAEIDLGKQLHASVRTSNLETSFRLLVFGADPNYFHDEKGTTPLHVATKSDQKLQVELLLCYGADPNYPDKYNLTPIDYAKRFNNNDLMYRLIENQYEITDAFSNYLTLRKPDHKNGIHFLIPQNGFESNPLSLNKLQKLSNQLFEELAMDVADEIDRREMEAIWLSCVDTIDLTVVPFLPVNATLSTTKNQGRQKLARFSTPELKCLVYDLLLETQRRQMTQENNHLQIPADHITSTHISDDDPLYDSVASDEDYAETTKINQAIKDDKSIEELTKRLKERDDMILNLNAEINKLKARLEGLEYENDELRMRSQDENVGILNGESESLPTIFTPTNNKMSNIFMMKSKQNRKNQRPLSMFEARETMKTVPNWHIMKNQLKEKNELSIDKLSIKQSTDLITKCMQQLWKCLQEDDRKDCNLFGENVKHAVIKLVSLLPKENESVTIKSMLDVLPNLIAECSALQIDDKLGDLQAVNNHISKIRDYTIDLAKYTKEIVVKYSPHM